MIVLDSSAVLAVLKGEAGDARVTAALDCALILTVSLAEVASVLARTRADAIAITAALALVKVPVVPVDEALAIAAGVMMKATAPFGLSLADRLCLAFARRYELVALTADRAWARAGAAVGARVELIR